MPKVEILPRKKLSKDPFSIMIILSSFCQSFLKMGIHSSLRPAISVTQWKGVLCHDVMSPYNSMLGQQYNKTAQFLLKSKKEDQVASPKGKLASQSGSIFSGGEH